MFNESFESKRQAHVQAYIAGGAARGGVGGNGGADEGGWKRGGEVAKGEDEGKGEPDAAHHGFIVLLQICQGRRPCF